MILNHVKLKRAVTFMKYAASVVSLIFLSKPLISNKMKFLASNLLLLAEEMENELKTTISGNIYRYSFLYPI